MRGGSWRGQDIVTPSGRRHTRTGCPEEGLTAILIPDIDRNPVFDESAEDGESSLLTHAMESALDSSTRLHLSPVHTSAHLSGVVNWVGHVNIRGRGRGSDREESVQDLKLTAD
jgi:hypothetical protein